MICPLANGNGVAYFLAGKFEIRTPMQLKVHASGSCLMVFSRFLENRRNFLQKNVENFIEISRKISKHIEILRKIGGKNFHQKYFEISRKIQDFRNFEKVNEKAYYPDGN